MFLFGTILSSCGDAGTGKTPEKTSPVVVETLQDKIEKEDLTGLVKTPLSLVYKRGSEFYILPGYAPNRKEELWGYALQSGVFLEIAYGKESMESRSWYSIKGFSENMKFKGNQGRMPEKEKIKSSWGRPERLAMEATAAILAKNGIKAQAYENKWHVIWTADGMGELYAYYFVLHSGDTDYHAKGGVPFEKDRGGLQAPRIAVAYQDVKVEEIVETGTVKTALPIVYQMPDGSFKVLPHLDLSLKKYVCGVWSGGMCVALKNSRARIDWDLAMEKAPKGWELPANGDKSKFYPERDKFNKTMVTLREDGIDAEQWIVDRQYGYYWTKTTGDSPTWAYWFHVAGQTGGSGAGRKDNPHYARYLRKDVKR